ncbi:60S ribosomal protein L6 [Perkinsela sp. CCAP 1560/4]|nr:60S ribosomal protein L6 [Perkinsela sp. CCAP 1560/4]|eukprot:KNH05407.1 60S ribosomal protein L6 [Perkinsela sp. CCAP 1560/4]
MPQRTQKTRLRESIQPGTVCILLAGRFRGARVINLGEIEESGLIAVTGPFKLNGVPIRRVNPAYVIATKTKVDISGVDTEKARNPALFQKDRKAMRKRSKEQFLKVVEKQSLAKERKLSELEARKKLQSTIDEKILKSLSASPSMLKYLSSRFTLRRNEAPHSMVF